MIEITVGDRIREIRQKHRLNQTKFAEVIGVHFQTVSRWERNELRPTAENLSDIAAKFGVDISWLMAKSTVTSEAEERGPIPPSTGTIPVISMIQGGEEGYWENAYPVGYGYRTIKRPYDVNDPNAFAVEVRGQSMSPKYDEGDVIVVCPSKEVHSGDSVAVKLKSGAVMVKRVRFAGDMVMLESINPAYEPIIVSREDIDFIRKIVWKKER